MCMSYENFIASTWPTFEDSSFHPEKSSGPHSMLGESVGPWCSEIEEAAPKEHGKIEDWIESILSDWFGNLTTKSYKIINIKRLFSRTKIGLKINFKINIWILMYTCICIIYIYVFQCQGPPPLPWWWPYPIHPPFPAEWLGAALRVLCFLFRCCDANALFTSRGMFKQILIGRNFTCLITSYTRSVT